ncbi:MAG TPA: dienelactone hydrolase family protein [Solirubrobacteraceae bacterium]|nr:dienelactone hydrolase family protein [Solirubrobacteraceae bacterium]
MTEARIEPSPDGVPGAVTDPATLRGEELTYPGYAGDAVNAFLARPAETGALPGMVVIHEAGGLNEHIRDVVARIAQLGYVTIGVDLYTREGGPPEPGNMNAIMERIFSLPDERVLEDLTGAIDVLRGRRDARGPVGIIGFCMGGRYSLLAACSLTGLDAAVDCWGGFIDRSTPDEVTTPERPRPPLDLVAGLGCPLMAAVGAEDQNPSPALGELLAERAIAAGKDITVDVYDGAGHAFFADYRPSYRPGPAHELWSRVVPFLHRHLQGDTG